MTFEDEKNATNLILMSTVAEVAKNVIRSLDGRGLVLQSENETLTDDTLCHQIVSRINYNLKRQ